MQNAIRRAKKIIAVSTATKNEIINTLKADPEKIVVTYEGVESSLMSDQNTNTNIDSPYFLYVGNAYPHKNLDRLLRAFVDFLQSVPHVRLVLVGKEDYFYMQLKRELLVMKLDKSVIVLSNISDSQLVSLYKHAIGVVIPSLMEGFGLPAIEAMINGCSVVASDIPSLKEICQDAAVYFNPNDFRDIAQKLQMVYREQGIMAGKKELGRKRAQLFNWDDTARQTLEAYESSIGLRQSK